MGDLLADERGVSSNQTHGRESHLVTAILQGHGVITLLRPFERIRGHGVQKLGGVLQEFVGSLSITSRHGNTVVGASIPGAGGPKGADRLQVLQLGEGGFVAGRHVLDGPRHLEGEIVLLHDFVIGGDCLRDLFNQVRIGGHQLSVGDLQLGMIQSVLSMVRRIKYRPLR